MNCFEKFLDLLKKIAIVSATITTVTVILMLAKGYNPFELKFSKTDLEMLRGNNAKWKSPKH